MKPKRFVWSGWQDNTNTLEWLGFKATVKMATPNEENRYRTREWSVTCEDQLVGRGYTLGSRGAYLLCEIVMYTAAVSTEPYTVAKMILEEYEDEQDQPG